MATNSNELVQSSKTHTRQYQNQVVFENVADHYVKDQDVTAHFTIVHDMKDTTNNDEIGLLRIGSTNIQECLAYAPVQFNLSTTSGSTYQGTATFPTSSLPVTDDEFYQFCYIVNKQKCLGSSIPFQLNCSIDYIDLLESALPESSLERPTRQANNDGFIALGDDDNEDIVVIHTKRMLIEDKLRQENQHLLEINRHLEQQKDEFKAKIDLLEIKSNEFINKAKNDMESLVSTHNSTITELSSRQQLEEKLRREYEACQALCVQYQSESLKFAERCRSLEEANAKLFSEINKLEATLSTTKQINEELAGQIDEYQKRLVESNELLKLAKQNQAKLDQQLRDLRLTTEKYQMSMQGQIDAYAKQSAQQENQIHALESANGLLKEELIATQNENLSLKTVTEQDAKVIKELQQQIQDLMKSHRLEDEKKQRDIERLSIQLEQSNYTHNDYMLLKSSYQEIEKRCIKHQKSEIEVKKQFSAYKEYVGDLERKVQVLTERIAACADEYKTLYKKYVALERTMVKMDDQDKATENSVPKIPLNTSDLNEESSTSRLHNSQQQPSREQQQYLNTNNDSKAQRESTMMQNSNGDEEIRECPLCYWEFPKNFTLNKKKDHIDNHFTSIVN